ncbi:DUF6584 family protein [Knoellia flava]|uniref:Uncharacterized protein n=1 Tax=Knoellia flava TaxID=913969 RepID=A0A8H9FPB9_9MICO|nr:DUF6584 family protein [Knoellia flava]GGB66505.1 hypothetical protein GCM10011314_02060 [Knoellia flava]
MTGLERARADLARGDARKARDRLKGLVATFPDSVEIRGLLAEAYRRDRQFPEAGRWGYLVGDAATDAERRAFERHAGFGWRGRITESRLRRLLRTDELAVIADDDGRGMLRTLPSRRHPDRPDGLGAALARAVATLRAALTWR